MDTPVMTVYRELADHYERQGQTSMRDRFLMLAADAAMSSGQRDEAERLRQRLLAGNRHHMLRPYGSFEEASRAADVQSYLEGLRANYPPEQASDMLNALRGGDEAPAPAPAPTPAPAPPAAAASSRLIPPTAPLLDLNASARQQRALDQTRPFEPMNLESAPQARPRSQPAPLQPPQGAPLQPSPQAAPQPPQAAPLAPPQAAPPARSASQHPPLREIPLGASAAPKKPERPPRPAPPPLRPSPPVEPERPPQKGGWASVALTVAAALTALAAAALALGRPFLR
jgi:hypothetical protein